MMKHFIKSYSRGPLGCALAVALIFSALYGRLLYRDASSYLFRVSMSSSTGGMAVLYLDTGRGLSEDEAIAQPVEGGDQFRHYQFQLPRKSIHSFRFDPLAGSGAIAIKTMEVVNGLGISLLTIDLRSLKPLHHIRSFDAQKHLLSVVTEDQANDPQIAVPLSGSLALDSSAYFPWFSLLVRGLSGFLIAFIAVLALIWMLRKRAALAGFFDHPLKTSSRWVRQNRLFFSVALCLFGFRVFFILTYPLDTCSDASTYYLLMQNGTSTLVHATGYPYFMHFFIGFLPTKTDVLIFQHLIDFGIQLLIMSLAKRRFGLMAAITAGVLYGFELRTINWLSRSTPEWLQGVFFVLAFVGALEAYFAQKPVKKMGLYLLSSWFFIWSVLVKFLTVVMLPVYLILFLLEGKQWKGRWLCAAAMCAVVIAQALLFIYSYHLPSTGTTALTHDVGWILSEKLRSFIPVDRHFTESGPWSKRYGILISQMPKSASEIDGHGVYRNVNAVPSSVRKPYRDQYKELLSKSDAQLQEIIVANGYRKELEQNFIVSNQYLGLAETDQLLTRVFFETMFKYPKAYALNVLQGIKEAFFIKTSYYIAILRDPRSSEPDHPFQMEMTDISQELPWGYARFNVSPHIRCLYEDPVFLKAGVRFFTFWGEHIYVPTILKWALLALAVGIAAIQVRGGKPWAPALLYLTLGVMVMVSLIVLSNLIFIYRDKEFFTCQHLFCLLLGISLSSLGAWGKALVKQEKT